MQYLYGYILMDYEDIVDYAVDYTGIDISYASALKYVNKRRNFVISKLQILNEDFFRDTKKTNLIAEQNEYNLPTSTSADGWYLSLKRVEIKYKSTDEYREVVPSDTLSTLKYDGADYISANQANPFYEIKDGSIFIYPTPSEAITDGLVIRNTQNLPDITVASTEWDFFGQRTELRTFVQLIADGLIADLYGKSRQYDDKAIAEQDFVNHLSLMIKTVSNRGNNIITDQMPDLSHLT